MIYDCFLFFNELDLLEIRLNELKNIVDVFVLCESTTTFTGKPKPLYFELEKDRFKDFNIIHLVHTGVVGVDDAWYNEINQRNFLIHGIQDCNPNDYIILSDVDEIPNAKALSRLTGDFHSLGMTTHMYYLNCVSTQAWHHAKYFKYGAVNNRVLNEIRMLHDALPDTKIENCGTHFANIGGIEQLQRKLNSFSHQEINTDKINNREFLAHCLKENLDFLGRSYTIKTMNIDTLPVPEYIKKNKEKFKHLIKP